MARLRLALHALDRTGPPMLALALARWIESEVPNDELQVVAFRGGALLEHFSRIARTEVLLEPSEAWDHSDPDPDRVTAIRNRLSLLPEPDATLLVSVAGGQVLPLSDAVGPVITWVVERGEDLHWLDPPVDVAARTHRWIAGSRGSLVELSALLVDRGVADTGEIHLVPEFIAPSTPSPEDVRRTRETLAPNDEALVLGAGIATHRKAPDLFLEVALAHRRAHGAGARFVWVGGEDDPLFPLLSSEVDRLGAEHVSILPSVGEIDTTMAAADVFLHTARLDAFPLVCLHAAAVGTPVVAFSGCGGTEEMLGDSFVGSPYPDVAGLAARTAELLDGSGPVDVARGQREAVLGEFVSDVGAPRVHEQLRATIRSGVAP